MKSKTKIKTTQRLAIAGLLVAVFITGCLRHSSEEVNEKREAATKSTQEYIYAQKADFVFRMHRELSVLQGELDRLSRNVEESTGEAKVEAKLRLEAVRAKLDSAKIKLDQAEDASSSAWSDMKQGFQRSYDELNDSFDEARRWLSDKIEPD